MLKFREYIIEANSQGILADKHLGDGVSFKNNRDEVFIIKNHAYYDDIQKALEKLVKKGYSLEVEIGDPKNTGIILQLDGDKRKILAIRYGTAVKGIAPSEFGLAYANSSEKFDLKPQSLGIQEKWYKKAQFVKDITSGINSRNDITEALKEYLLLLVEYYDKNEPKSYMQYFKEYDYDNFPMNEIKKNFGEMLGPLAIISKSGGLFDKLKLDASSEIFFPLRGNEPLMDFAMRKGNNEYTFSAKSGAATTNTVKPGDVVRMISENPRLKKKWTNRVEFQVMKLLDENSIVKGPVLAAAFLRIKGINQKFVKDWLTKNENTWKYDKSIYEPFVTAYGLGKKPTYGEILFRVETLITSLSKGKGSKLDFDDMFQDAVGGKIYYINLISIKGGIPQFKTYEGNAPKTELRTKNAKNRFKDKIGIQIR